MNSASREGIESSAATDRLSARACSVKAVACVGGKISSCQRVKTLKTRSKPVIGVYEHLWREIFKHVVSKRSTGGKNQYFPAGNAARTCTAVEDKIEEIYYPCLINLCVIEAASELI